MTESKDRILTRRETAQRLGVSERTLDRIVSTNGGLRKVQLSPRRVGFGERAVEALIAQLTAKVAA
jgi:predicted DNA-binding transcriptional regulator AlpA